MQSDIESLNRLKNTETQVSCHYFIKTNGEIIQMVPDLYVAWHAGLSSWKKDINLNLKSIGIEISNPGHNNSYKNFTQKQVKSIIKLLKSLK